MVTSNNLHQRALEHSALTVTKAKLCLKLKIKFTPVHHESFKTLSALNLQNHANEKKLEELA